MLVENPYSDWYRVGPGHYFEFEAPDEVVQSTFLDCLPHTYAPYQLLTVSAPPGRAQEEDRTAEVWRLTNYLESRRRGLRFYSLFSSILTPSLEQLPNPCSFTIEAACSLSGVINVQIRNRNELPRLPPNTYSTIGMVRKAARQDGTICIEHVEYYEIYQALKKAFRPYLVPLNRGGGRKHRPSDGEN